METTALPGRPPPESVCLSVAGNDMNVSAKRTRRPQLRLAVIVNIVISILVVCLLYLLEFGYIPQNYAGFLCKDPTLSRPFKGEIISSTLMVAGALFGPLLSISAIELHRQKSIDKKLAICIWRWYREVLLGLCITLNVVEIGKVLLGEPRPHFLSTCQPDTAFNCEPGTFITDYKCSNTYYGIYFNLDSARSFPSGHAALSIFVSLFCMCHLHWRLNSRKIGRLVKLVAMMLYLLWTLVCSLTRISDYRHHWWDVLAGNIIGLVVAVYIICTFCKNFQTPIQVSRLHKPSASTTTLLDVKNKDATSVII